MNWTKTLLLGLLEESQKYTKIGCIFKIGPLYRKFIKGSLIEIEVIRSVKAYKFFLTLPKHSNLCQ